MIYTTAKHKQSTGTVSIFAESIGLESGWCAETQRISEHLLVKFELLFSRKAVSNSLRLHGLQHARLLCPSPSPKICSNLCPLNQCKNGTGNWRKGDLCYIVVKCWVTFLLLLTWRKGMVSNKFMNMVAKISRQNVKNNPFSSSSCL